MKPIDLVGKEFFLFKKYVFQNANLQLIFLATLIFFFFTTITQAEQHDQSSEYELYWHQWRGPTSNGIAPRSNNPPLEWSEQQNILWKLEIPGEGHASPIIWKDQIFILTSTPIEIEKKEQPIENEDGDTSFFGIPLEQFKQAAQTGGRNRRGEAPNLNLKLAVICVNRTTGQVEWERIVRETQPHEGTHNTATWASYSPITDGDYLYANFGSFGLYCLDLSGNVQWEIDLGDMRTRNSFGEGSSATLHNNTLIVNWDHEGDSFIVALDKETGDQLWRVERDEPTSWSTPIVTDYTGLPQIIVNATNNISAYDLQSGEILWEASGMTTNVIPCPVFHSESGMAYFMSGFRGNALMAIQLANATGDITDTSSVVWQYNQDTPYVPSPLLYGDNLYFLKNRNGILSCLDAKTGSVHYGPERLTGIGDVYASPVGAGGYIFLPDRDGNIAVLKHGTELEVLAINQLDDGFSASPAIVDDRIYLRGHRYLYCVANMNN